MGLYEQVKSVCKSNNVSINKLEKELGFARSSINKFNTNKPSIDKLQKIADFFGVTVDFLTTGGKEDSEKQSKVIQNDDHKNELDVGPILEVLEKDVNALLFCKGEPLDDESLDILIKGLELRLARIKRDKK